MCSKYPTHSPHLSVTYNLSICVSDTKRDLLRIERPLPAFGAPAAQPGASRRRHQPFRDYDENRCPGAPRAVQRAPLHRLSQQIVYPTRICRVKNMLLKD